MATEQLVAAAPTTSDPMSSIMKRIDEIETQLKVVASSKKKWDRRSKPPQSRESFKNCSTDQLQVQSTYMCSSLFQVWPGGSLR